MVAGPENGTVFLSLTVCIDPHHPLIWYRSAGLVSEKMFIVANFS